MANELSPHDDSEFLKMCREHEIEGTAMVALCGEFWARALATRPGAAAEPMTVPLTALHLIEDAEQAHDQCRAVVHMALSLAEVYVARAAILASSPLAPIEIIGESSAVTMEYLGDLLSNMDAVEEGDAWLDPIFDAAQARWPQASPLVAPQTAVAPSDAQILAALPPPSGIAPSNLAAVRLGMVGAMRNVWTEPAMLVFARSILKLAPSSPPAAAGAIDAREQEVPKFPQGWVPLIVEYEPGYPEEVAYGPQIMMDRLKKWLDRYFALLIASREEPAAAGAAQAVGEDALSEAIILAGRHGVPVRGFGDESEMRFFAEKLAALIAAVRAPQWRCFHCDECFTTADSAMEHFGRTERQSPACQIDITEYRAMEQRMLAYTQEDADIHREMHARLSDHQLALVREEERGYSRGLADAKKNPEDLGLVAAAASTPEDLTQDDRNAIDRGIEAIEHMLRIGDWGDCCPEYVASLRKIADTLAAPQPIVSTKGAEMGEAAVDTAHKAFKDYMAWADSDDRHRMEKPSSHYEREAIRAALKGVQPVVRGEG